MQLYFSGFGFGLIYLPAVVCVGYYFETKRALATGIAVCGSGVGTMIFPPLINLVIEHFGWKGANLFIAGMILNCAVSVLVCKVIKFKLNLQVSRQKIRTSIFFNLITKDQLS